MNKHQRIVDGSSIHGDKLKVYFQGDGILSSSFVIEHAGNSSCLYLMYIVACIIAVAVAVYWELVSLTVNSCFVCTSTVLLSVICFKVCYVSVVRESVIVVKDLGVQLTRFGAFGVQTSQFIEQERIVDVLIHEVITMSSTPRLETIKPIYHGVKKILETN